MAGLTPKQARFVDEYLLDLNASAAYVRAGFSPRGANTHAARLVSNGLIQKAIAQAKKARSERTGIDQDWVLTEAEQLYLQCTGQIPVAKVVLCEGMLIQGEAKEFNGSAANKALQLVGNHVKIQAFKEKLEITADEDLIQALRRGRERSSGEKY